MNEDTRIDPAAVKVSVLSRGIVGAKLAIDAVMPLGDVALRVRESGKLASSTATVRRVLAKGGVAAATNAGSCCCPQRSRLHRPQRGRR